MYTEMIFGARFKKETPQEVIDTLKVLVGDEDSDKELPVDRYVLKGASYYFGISFSHAELRKDQVNGQYSLSSRNNIKNYHSEIQTFLEWIKPWIEQGSGDRDFYAIVTYEEANEPTIYYLRDAREQEY